jgi:adenylate cyclase
MLQLVFSIDGEKKTLPLSAPEVRFGRSGDNEVVLPDYSVSRRHAAVRRDGDLWYVYDLKSTNGVQVNHANVQRSQIRGGDLLKIGVFEIRVESLAVQPREEGSEVDKSAATEISSPHQVRSAALPLPAGQGHAQQAPAQQAPAQQAPPSQLPPSSPAPSRADFAGPPVAAGPISSAISNATIVRSISDYSAALARGREAGREAGRDSSEIRQSKRKALDQAYGTQIFGFLTQLAQLLITTDSDDEILKHVLDIAFDALPVDRGFILLRDLESGDLRCELVRINERVELRPKSEVPISKTMLESVMRERVALLTYDALSDQRLAGTESVRIHQIRAAMCAPLWAGEKIIGVMQLDTPHHTGSFTEQDVDLLATLANFCAVAIERNHNARDAEFQRGVRTRLERYHSPGVIEQVLREDPTAVDEGLRGLKRAEVSVLFADIVGFTGFSEKAPPEEVAELMEGYFTHAVEAIFSSGGTLDKFIGDCVMAFFGAPVQQPDHAHRAVVAAVRIREALDDWNAERQSRGLPVVKLRVGINSGPVVVGDIGSNRRVDYTVLGNTVNVAARLEESVAKPGEIVIGAETWRQLAGRIPTEPMGDFQLKGLSQQIPAYRVLRQPSSL